MLGAVHHGVQLGWPNRRPPGGGARTSPITASLPGLELATGSATVLVGALDGATSPARGARRWWRHLDLRSAGTSTIPLDPGYEHAVVVLEGAVALDGRDLTPGHLGYLGLGATSHRQRRRPHQGPPPRRDNRSRPHPSCGGITSPGMGRGAPGARGLGVRVGAVRRRALDPDSIPSLPPLAR